MYAARQCAARCASAVITSSSVGSFTGLSALTPLATVVARGLHGSASAAQTAESAAAALGATKVPDRRRAPASSDTAESGAAASAGPTREELFREAEQRRMESVFYDPAIISNLSKREKQVFTRPEDEPPMPLMADHGYLYGTTAATLDKHLSGLIAESPKPEAARTAAEMIRRSLSTRTANVAAMMSFRKAELMRKFAGKPFDTGASRVQVAMLTERISRVTAHLSANKKDKFCKRSLAALTLRRRKVLEYMTRADYQGYRVAVRELGLRPVPLVYSRHLPKVRLESHKEINDRNRRLKNRVSRGYKGH